MIGASPFVKFAFAERDAARFRDDVEEWTRNHEVAKDDLWVWERLVDDANRLFALLLAFDVDFRRAVRSSSITPEFYIKTDDALETLFAVWFAASNRIAPDVRRLSADRGAFTGSDRFFENIREAGWILSPPDDMLDDENMIQARDAAVEAARRGDVEPAFDDVRP